MELKDQVCSLELAKKLKELGVKQESVCYWTHRYSHDEYEVDYIVHGPYQSEDPEPYLYAYTVAELGEMMLGQEMPYYAEGGWHSAGYYDLQGGRNRLVAETEADARAKMLVYLIENKLITV